MIRVQLWALFQGYLRRFQGYLGRKLIVINGDEGPAVGPTETMVPGLPGQKVEGNIR